ncbi:MAG: response regulator [Gammaproteobacteria bacterium]|jgi:two-component system sensor histidine kinase BarA
MLSQRTDGFWIGGDSMTFGNNDHKIYKDTEKFKILLIEGDEFTDKANAVFLKQLGYDVDVARNGCHAVKLLKNNYDLFLLEVGLPDIDGVRVCEIIRTIPKFSHTPVIFLTAFGEGLKAECQAAGGNDFAMKPLPMEELQNLVDKWLLDNNNSERKYGCKP